MNSAAGDTVALYQQLEDWVAAGQLAAIATVVSTWGSSPRPVGSQLIVNEAQEFEGSVSGGCVEAAVIGEAGTVMQTGQPKMLKFGVANETAWEVGLTCGGEIQVYVEAVEATCSNAATVRLSDIQRVAELRRECQPVAVVKPLNGTRQRLVTADAPVSDKRLQKVIAQALQNDRSRIAEVRDEQYFIHIFNSPLRMIVVGAVHIAKHLIRLAKMCDYDVMLIDPRRSFTKSKYLASVDTVTAWPDAAIKQVQQTVDRIAIVTLTHDPKLDEPALIAALESDAFYIGALGSKRTHQSRCQRLRESGVSAADIERIHAPVGLDIGAQSPAEIAVSIMAEMTRSLRTLQQS